MNVLIAPDKFKGSLSAGEAGMAIRDGLREADPSVTCYIVPLADGGEGTTKVLTQFSNGTFQSARVLDPLFRRIEATYGLSHDGGTAFIEMASASGLDRLRIDERDPLLTSTYGTGELIRHALEQGVRNICLGIGGSATNDGGMGAMIALGVQFFDEAGTTLRGAGHDLQKIHRLDVSALHPAMKEASFTIFCDVDNPLHGPHGAAFIFSPQKGASPATVELLDRGLKHYESILKRHGYTNTYFPGAGAGGGMPVALAVFGRSVICPGIEYILDFVGLEQKVREADLVITGEGKLDEQTLSGKVVKGVAALAARHRKPVLAVAGSVTLTPNELSALHISHALSLVDDQTAREEAIQNAATLIRRRVAGHFRSVSKG